MCPYSVKVGVVVVVVRQGRFISMPEETTENTFSSCSIENYITVNVHHTKYPSSQCGNHR